MIDVQADLVAIATAALESCRTELQAQRQRVARLKQAADVASPAEVIRLRDEIVVAEKSVADLEALLLAYQREFDSAHDVQASAALADARVGLRARSAETCRAYSAKYAEVTEGFKAVEARLLELAQLQKDYDNEVAEDSHLGAGLSAPEGGLWDWDFPTQTFPTVGGQDVVEHWTPPAQFKRRLWQALGKI